MHESRILVVDDETNAREGLSKLLRRSGYDVTSVENGCDALREINEGNFDLVITDMKMPQMDGIALLKEIKGLISDIGVIMITAFGEVSSYLEAMDLGAFEYLNKPVNVDELKRIIWRVLSEKDLKQC